MTLQLQDLALVSMQDFTDLIAQPPVSMVQLYSYTTLFIFNSFKVESDKITFTSRRTESKTLALLRLSVKKKKEDLVSTCICRINYHHIYEVSGNK